ncbi:hypothetical protein G9A89_016073 [Geosiphon pyriformis]|nr:hypothetical protein G9A89_016073 [Geosiphon pyriformis]
MEIAISLARKKEINVNNNLKRQGIHSDWAVVIKKILINTLKKIIVTALAEFGKIKLIKAVVKFAELDQAELLAVRWFFLIGKNSVHVTMAERDCNIWTSRDWFRALLFTLLAAKLTSLITHLILATKFDMLWLILNLKHPIFGGIKLSWTRLDLVYCRNCECFGYFAMECDTTIAPNAKSSRFIKKVTLDIHCLQLAKLYVKKNVPIFCSAAFGGKFWTSGFGTGFFSLGIVHNKGDTLANHDSFSINNCQTSLEHSLKLLANQVSDVLYRLNGVELVPLVPVSKVGHSNVSILVLSMSDANMVLDILQPSLPPSSLKIKEKTVDLGLSNLKVLTSKNLDNMISIVTKTKLRSDIKSWIMSKFDVDEIPGQLISVCFLFKNKLSVMILGLYTGVSVGTHFGQAAVINFMIFKVVNSSFFVILGGNFNENGSQKSASFKFCLGLDLVNTFDGHLLAKAIT